MSNQSPEVDRRDNSWRGAERVVASYRVDVTRRATSHLVQDSVLAAGLAAVAIAEIWVPFESRQGEGSSVLATVVAVLSCALLAIRRVWPLLPMVTALILPVVFTASALPVLFWGQFVPLLVAVYSVARHGRGRQSLYGAVAAAGLLLFLDLTVELLSTPSEIVFHWSVVTLAFLAGRGLRISEGRAVEAALTAAAVESASRERTLAAVAEERARIARELHDVVAHSVTVMVVQAGAAEQAADSDPAFVRSALGAIRTTGAGALGEMRRVVAMLREPDASSTLEPQPGIASLPALIEEARAAGLPTELHVHGDERTLPAGLNLAAYRIVQEALTNVRRHASASCAEVSVRLTGDCLEIEVRDDGSGMTDEEPHVGHGLIGMRERAAMYGGELHAGSEPDVGFTVRAVLPLGTTT